tara:strand:- start:357 stop:872 length:516 start_codon:yes stop_codon:yes gene_type:complete
MAAIFPNETNLYIVSSGIAGSAVASSDAVTTEITSFSVNGGGRNIESVPVFGNAFIDKETPRDQFEVSMDVVVSYANAVRWDGLLMGGNISSTSAESSSEALAKRIFIEATDTSKYRTMAMDNCRAVTWEPEMGADEYLKGTMTFKFSATDSTGGSNLKVNNTIKSNSYFN